MADKINIYDPVVDVALKLIRDIGRAAPADRLSSLWMDVAAAIRDYADTKLAQADTKKLAAEVDLSWHQPCRYNKLFVCTTIKHCHLTCRSYAESTQIACRHEPLRACSEPERCHFNCVVMLAGDTKPRQR